MVKFNFKILVFIFLSVFLFGCAGLQKMKNNANQIQFSVTPEILETHGGSVDVSIDGRFPQKYFNNKATLVATPVLKYDEGETAYEPVTLQGEKVEANNRVISYNNGGSFNYRDNTDFTEDMRIADLEVRIKATKGSKSIDFEPIKIADGVLATSTLLMNIPKPILGIQKEENTSGKYDPNIDAFQRIVPDEYVADIHYLINSSYLRSEERNSDDVAQIQEYTKDAYDDERKELKGVEISAYASPDGTVEYNADLAESREEVSTDFISEALESAGIETDLKAKYTPEDWEGFKELMENSNIQDKELILRVLSMYTDPEVREREIKNLSEAFTAVAEQILPRLRRAKIITSVDLIGKTDEEIMELAESDPASLNPAELLYAATLSDDLDNQLSIYNSFIQIYPDDWRGPNNAGFILVNQMKYDEAKPLFESAERLKNDEPIIKNNLGAIALYEGDVQTAEEYFGAAAGAGDEVNYNLGIVSVKNADYDLAVRYFNLFSDVNTALAKILTGDNNGAINDLEQIDNPDCFMKEYLMAVIAAKTAKEESLYESLGNAIKINPELKPVAKTDMNFVKYFEEPQFKSIVE